jgi:hypothetical protein
MTFFKLIDLSPFYFTNTEYTNANYSLLQLYDASYSLNELYERGYNIYELWNIDKFSIIDFFNSIIPVDGSNGLYEIMNRTIFLDSSNILVNYYTINTQQTIAIQKIFEIFSIFDLYNAGFSLTFMKNQNIDIFKVYQLINNPNVEPSVEYGDLKTSGYTILDIYSLNSKDPTIFNIQNIYYFYGFTLKEFYNSGFTAYQMKNTSGINQITPTTLYDNGYSVIDLYNAGYSYLDLSDNGFTINDLFSTNLTIDQINNFSNSNLSLNDLIITYQLSLQRLINEGYTLNEISSYSDMSYPISEYISLGYTLNNLYDASFSLNSLYLGFISEKIFTLSQLLSLRFDVPNLIYFDINLINYYNASYSTFELFHNGFYLLFLKNYYSLSNFKNDDINTYTIYETNLFTIYDFSNSGYTLIEYFLSNIPSLFIQPIFTLSQLVTIGYEPNIIASRHFYPAASFYNLGYPVSMLTNYYSINELLEGGYSKKDLNIEGNKISIFCCEKKKCLNCLPSKLGSSLNNTRSSSKILYSQNIKNRIGGSYSSTYSPASINNELINQANILCLNQSNSTTLSTNVPLCKTINIPSKTSVGLSYFIRKYIERQLLLYKPNEMKEEDLKNTIIKNTINDIIKIQKTELNIPIYTIIQNYFNPSTIILL